MPACKAGSRLARPWQVCKAVSRRLCKRTSKQLTSLLRWLTITVSVLPNRTQKFCFLWEQRISILGLQTRPRLFLSLKSTPGFTTSFSPRLLPLLYQHRLDCPSTTVRPDSTPSLLCAQVHEEQVHDHTQPAPLAPQLLYYHFADLWQTSPSSGPCQQSPSLIHHESRPR